MRVAVESKRVRVSKYLFVFKGHDASAKFLVLCAFAKGRVLTHQCKHRLRVDRCNRIQHTHGILRVPLICPPGTAVLKNACGC